MTQRFTRLPPEAGSFMQVWADDFLTELETAIETIETTLQDIIDLNDLVTSAEAAIVAAQTAADTANAAASAVTGEQSLNASFVTNYVAPLVSADAGGTVTIAAHDRVYGDGTTVAVSGGSVNTGLSNPNVARIYYVQPSRAGGAVTYLSTTDEAVAAQTGDTHSVGAVTIPAAGTQSGGAVRPPGYAEP